MSLGAKALHDIRAALANAPGPDAGPGPGLPESSPGNTPDGGPALDPDLLIDRARTWSAAETRRFRDVLDPMTDEDRMPAARCVLLNHAPLALSAGAWSQRMSSAGNAETEPALRVLALYASDVGVGLPDAHRGADYRALLNRHQLAQATPGMRLAGSEQLISASFRLPGVLLAMSRLPEHLWPEILGADLCPRAAGLARPLAALVGNEPDARTARSVDPGAARPGGQESGPALSAAAARALLAEPRAGTGEQVAERLRHGFTWTLDELSPWSTAVLAETALTRHPDYGTWRLIHTRARQAAVYHSGYELAGRPLASWFKDLDQGPQPFPDALAASPPVHPGQPDRSHLVRGLINEHGPTFRVYTDDEAETLRRRIARLPEHDRLRDATDGGAPAADRALHQARHRHRSLNPPTSPAARPHAALRSRPSRSHRAHAHASAAGTHGPTVENR
ncbi:hypothetical protein SAMN06297387_108212 [Streptomyces zhaozhouensis]|uniref:Uncharacterized protein n=1 Tax=Streptomyces zhaozhouensis TaxID=1300267 RepID=A0A286DWJ7_9ACTN|nr:hypothetical protein [Streptomyces zhaozhouensis]SOD63049.1 hypothetical protein SAMN06297387_108212 [Streptomyces zhaozhouensis]